MPIDTLLVYVGVYGSVADAEADYEGVKVLHTEAGLIDAYDAAVIESRCVRSRRSAEDFWRAPPRAARSSVRSLGMRPQA